MQPARCALLTKAGNASLIVLIVLAGSLRPARADPSLPIVPPAGWRAVPSSFMPNLALTWQNGPSSFAIVTTQISASTSEALHELGVQASESGAKVEKSTTKFVCRSPAVRVDVRKPLAGGALAIVEQAQSLEGNSFLAVYRRPAQLPADPAIVGLLDRFCGVATLAGLAPPPDWRATHRRFLGIWLSPNLSQAITVQQTDPQPDLAQLALGAMSESSGRSLQRIASSSSTLCGLPAVFATFRAATPKGVERLDVAATQSARAAFVVSYGRPADQAADPAAEASLHSLCAGPAAMPALPSAAPSPASPMPSQSP